MNPDLKDFLELVRKNDEDDFMRISGRVGLEYEIPSYALELEKAGRTPILQFENVKGYDFPIVANVFAARKRYALALGVSENQLTREWIERSKTEIKPKEVSSGPVKEVVLKEDEVDLHQLPILTHFIDDGGPYITSGIVVARDPHSGIRNASFHRLQLKGKNKLGTSLHSRRHLWEYQRVAEEEGTSLEIAVVIGSHPLFCFGSGLWKGPIGRDEYNIAGGFMGMPLEIVKCETVDLEVPANAEIVLEGKILCNARKDEGPFGEFTGYSSKNSTRHVIEVTALTRRKDAIYNEIVPGMSTEHTLLLGIPQEIRILERLKEINPSVKAVAYPVSGVCRLHCYISIKKTADGQPANCIFAAFAEDPSLKLVIVVDDDIDVYNEREVLWALATRFQADKDVFLASRCMGALLDPSASAGLTAKMGIDATRPSSNWNAVRCIIPEEISEAVRQKLGLKALIAGRE